MTGLPFELIEALAKEYKIEAGWLWLYFNGFKRRVPTAVKEKIQCDVLKITGDDANGLRLTLAWQRQKAMEAIGKD